MQRTVNNSSMSLPPEMLYKDQCEELIVPVQGRVLVAEFSPHDWSASVLAVATETRVIIYKIQFKEEYHDVDNFTFEILHVVNPGAPTKCIAWSPETSIVVRPPLVRFAVACQDKNLRIISSSLTDDDTMLVLEGHTDFINSVAFEPDHGQQLASVGDDCTCRIWNQDGSAKTCITLNSPGMAVCYHREDAGKIMIAQKNGIIRFYSIDKEQSIMSLDCGHCPLLSAHWSPSNVFAVGAVAGCNVYLWDISKSSQPQDSRPIHVDGALKFLWSRTNPFIFAAAGQPKQQIKVTNIKDNQTLLSVTLPVGMSMSWHSKLNILVAIGDRKIHLFRL
ncbi:Nucleoporin Nup37 [Chamberlinius hualienensis]